MPRQHMTANACRVCRKKRTKCDGQEPCGRCSLRGENCSYEDKRHRTKEHLRSVIKQLQSDRDRDHALLQALVGPGHWRWVLELMDASIPPKAIANWILGLSPKPLSQTPSSAPCAASDSADIPPVRGFRPALCVESRRPPGQATASPTGPSSHGPAVDGSDTRRFSFDLQPSVSPPDLGILSLGIPRRQGIPLPRRLTEPMPRRWTRITSDTRFVQEKLAQFFSTSIPFLSLIPRQHFVQGLREGDPQYCTEALVNSIVGLACNTTTSQSVTGASTGDAFIEEARRLLAEERDHSNIPSIQALGVLALAEMSRANQDASGRLAGESVRACARLVLHPRQRGDERDGDLGMVRALAYCGGFSLARLVGLLTEEDLEPGTELLLTEMYPGPADASEDVSGAHIERGFSLQAQFLGELKRCPPLARLVFEVTEVVHTFLTHSHSKAMTAHDLDTAFKKCLAYHRQFANVASLDADAGPDVLFARIVYNFCLLGLIRPFVANPARLVGGLPASLSGDATPDNVCRQASEAIITLTGKYQARHSPVCLPPLLPYMVFAAALYQLSIATPPINHCCLQEQPIWPTGSLPSRSDYDSLPFPPGTMWTGSLANSTSTVVLTAGCKAEPSARSFRVRTAGSTEQLPLGLSTSPVLGGAQARRPSTRGYLSTFACPRGTDISSTTPPVTAMQPPSLVEMGTAQLASMSVLHRGAAKASRLLRNIRFTTTAEGLGIRPCAPDVLDGQVDTPGVRLYLPTTLNHSTSHEITSTDTMIPGVASPVPRSQISIPIQRIGFSPYSNTTLLESVDGQQPGCGPAGRITQPTSTEAVDQDPLDLGGNLHTLL